MLLWLNIIWRMNSSYVSNQFIFIFAHMPSYRMELYVLLWFIYLSSCWWTLSCLQFGAMTNNGVFNILKQGSRWTFVCISLERMPSSGIIGHMVCVSSVLPDNVKLISPKSVRKTITIGGFEWFLVKLEFEGTSQGKNIWHKEEVYYFTRTVITNVILWKNWGESIV